MTGLLIFVLLIIMMVIGIPIAFSVGATSLVYILATDTKLLVLAQRMFTQLDSITLIAVPAFIIAGAVMEVGGIAKRLVRFTDVLVGRITGGTSIVAIITSAFFAAISGSNVATTAAVGGILVPEMQDRGYDKAYAATVAAAGGTMGVIIPPSLSMVLYSSITAVSLTGLFMTGYSVGLIMMAAMIILCYAIAKKNGYSGSTEEFTWKELWKAFVDAIWALGSPIILVGGVFGGVFTPTEAAIVAVVYGIFVSLFIYKEIKFRDLYKIFLNAMITSGKITVIMAFAGAFGWILAAEQLPQTILTVLTSVTESKFVMLLIVNIVLLIAGCFMESGTMLIILTPVLMPLMAQYGVSLLHFGIVMILNLSIGNLTPPLGVCLYTGAMVAKCRVEEVSKKVIPFLIVLIAILMLITYVDAIPLAFVRMFAPDLIG